MSRESGDVARQRIEARPRPRRRMEGRVALRFPRLVALIARRLARLPPGSAVRRLAVGRGVRLVIEATNRGDFAAAFAFYHPDIEVTEPPEVVNLGMDPLSRGIEGRIAVQRRWHAEWDALRIEPEELTDLGDRLVVVGRMKGVGRSSGAAFDTEVGNVVDLQEGRVIRERIFLDHAAALEAAREQA